MTLITLRSERDKRHSSVVFSVAVIAWLFGLSLLTISFRRAINFKFLLQDHQKYNITQYGELGFSVKAGSDERLYWQPSQHHLQYISWENIVLFELQSDEGYEILLELLRKKDVNVYFLYHFIICCLAQRSGIASWRGQHRTQGRDVRVTKYWKYWRDTHEK